MEPQSAFEYRGFQVVRLLDRKLDEGRGLIFRVSGELLIRQAHIADEDLVCADVGGSLKSCRAAGRDPIVLIDAVAGDPDASNQFSVHEEREAAGKENHAILVGVGGLMALSAGIGHIILIQTEKWPRCGAVDT